MDTEKMDSILHKIDIGMSQANAPKRNVVHYEEDCSRNGLNRQMKFTNEECAKRVVWQ